MSTYFSATELLSPPTERAAFSDRQAYVCAELSKLAYFKFEGGHTLDQILKIAKEIIDDDTRFKILEQQLRNVLTSSPSVAPEAKKAFEEILNAADFQLVDTYSSLGTQAFICTKTIELAAGGKKTMAFLTFRGTEPKDFRDIKTDIKARLKGVKLDQETIDFHSGYLDSLEHIRADLVEELEKTSYDQLFITGHSLGGALAIVFTRLQAASTNGACYTFGAPPVGAVEVQNGLKTPVYEIINDAAQAYRGIVPPDLWHEPYMPREELREEMAAGVTFLGYEQAGELAGVMGVQDVQDVTLIRHAYVRTAQQGQGIGGALLAKIMDEATRPVLIGAWAEAVWAVRFYERRGFKVVSSQEKGRLLRKYWSVPDRQIETSVVLADQRWFAT